MWFLFWFPSENVDFRRSLAQLILAALSLHPFEVKEGPARHCLSDAPFSRSCSPGPRVRQGGTPLPSRCTLWSGIRIPGSPTPDDLWRLYVAQCRNTCSSRFRSGLLVSSTSVSALFSRRQCRNDASLSLTVQLRYDARRLDRPCEMLRPKSRAPPTFAL